MVISKDLQTTVLAGLLKSGYMVALTDTEISDNYFSDIPCKIIYKSLINYYNDYHELPSDRELKVAIESNYIDLGIPVETIKSEAESMYNYPDVNEDFLVDKCTELIKLVRTNRSLSKALDIIKSGNAMSDDKLANDLVNSMSVSLSKSGLFVLGDTDDLAEIRKKAIGDGQDNAIIKSVLPGINQSLQYRGYVKGTINLVVAPPGCFVGDTQIMTSDGESHSLFELYDAKQKYNIYGCTPEGDIVVDKYDSIYLSSYTRTLVDVEIDGVHHIRCTPDHPFMTTDGTYTQAENLLMGSALMPVTRHWRSDHESIHNYKNKSWTRILNPDNTELVNKFTSDKWRFNKRIHYVTGVTPVKLETPVPVFGIVDAGVNHNYAVAIGQNDEQGVIVSNTGKTSYLINEGAYAAMQGYSVLHVFLGDMIPYDGFIRYASCLSGTLQDEVVAMTSEQQTELVNTINLRFPGALNRIANLAYGAGEVTVDKMCENIKKEEEKLGMIFDMIIVDYADNLDKNNTNMYTEGGEIYDKLALFARTHHSVIMAASQPKISYWDQEIIPLEGAAESSKKQHIVDMMTTFNKPARDANIGSMFIPKVRRGNSGRIIRVRTSWEMCRLTEISEDDYNDARAQLGL